MCIINKQFFLFFSTKNYVSADNRQHLWFHLYSFSKEQENLLSFFSGLTNQAILLNIVRMYDVPNKSRNMQIKGREEEEVVITR